MADRLFAAAALATPRPVAFDMVLDLVIPRALGETVGVLESELAEVFDAELDVIPPVLGRDGVFPAILASLLAFIVAESTVFCLLKFDAVVWLLLVDIATAEGGQVALSLVAAPVLPRRGLLPLVALMDLCTPLCPAPLEPDVVWAGDGAGWPGWPPTPGAMARRDNELPLRLPSLSS